MKAIVSEIKAILALVKRLRCQTANRVTGVRTPARAKFF